MFASHCCPYVVLCLEQLFHDVTANEPCCAGHANGLGYGVFPGFHCLLSQCKDFFFEKVRSNEGTHIFPRASSRDRRAGQDVDRRYFNRLGYQNNAPSLGVPVEPSTEEQLMKLSQLPIIHHHVAAMPDGNLIFDKTL